MVGYQIPVFPQLYTSESQQNRFKVLYLGPGAREYDLEEVYPGKYHYAQRVHWATHQDLEDAHGRPKDSIFQNRA